MYADLVFEHDHRATLGPGQHLQGVTFSTCNNVLYSVHSSHKKETIILTANEGISNSRPDFTHLHSSFCRKGLPNIICAASLHTPVIVDITLEDCPLGFELAQNSLSCECHHTLVRNGISNCMITNHTGYIARGGRFWVNATFPGNKSNGVLIHKYCPYNYCNPDNITVDLRHPDTQCAFNHAGTLCGGCRKGYSLALGTNKCLECKDNVSLVLLILFAAAGFLLVFLIKFLDITVAHGTINGLIFYANIIQSGYGIPLSPQDQTYTALYRVLLAPIAWINLDFSYETCFFKGMNAYTKTWLQFVFPLYIWAIAGLIILISRYSSKATKLFGNNSVSVLATLFLLSYNKLLRNIINTFTVAKLVYTNNETASVLVWAYDGRIGYFSPEHAGLCVVALAALLLLWLPYTSTVLLVPWLRRKAHLKPLHWVNKLKPFYDAYYGPFKDKHHYWVGVLLLIRAIVQLIITISFTIQPNFIVLAIIVISTCLLMYTAQTGGLYKKWYVTLLETSFYLNLVIFGGGVFYS